MRFPGFLGSLVTASLLLAHASWVIAQQYSVTDVGVLGPCDSTAHGLNIFGQVVGESSDNDYRIYAFVTGADGLHIRNLGTVDSFHARLQPASVAYAINDGGLIIGTAGPDTGFVSAPNGGALSIKTFPPNADFPIGGTVYPRAISNAGQIAGWIVNGLSSGSGHAVDGFITTPNVGTFIDLNTPPAGAVSYGRGINNAGVVVGSGYSLSCDSSSGGVFTGANGAAPLECLPAYGATGQFKTVPLAINDRGEIVGYIATNASDPFRAFFSKDGTALTDLGAFGGNSSRANGINNAEQVVGQYVRTDGKKRAFLWTWDDAKKTGAGDDLNTLIDPSSGWTLTEAVAINDRGQIAANGTNPAFGYGVCQHALC